MSDNNAPWSVLLLIFLFSSLDAILTIQGIRAGVYTEANPIMESLLNLGFGAFFITKTLMVGLGLLVLGLWWRHTTAKVGVVLAVLSYSTIVVLHTINIITLVSK